MSDKLYTKTVHELHQLMKTKKVSSVELVTAIYERIEQVDDKVKAYLTLTKAAALIEAQKVDKRIADAKEIGPLEGIPVAIKDNMCTEGVKTTCASKILANYIPPYNATAVTELEDDGAIILGKLNMDEFAMGSSCENSAFFPTHNPWNLKTVPGGSSGGSAAAVAADEAPFALGSDTGGSIRQPASFCGVVGMKPTYGRVSRYGLVAFASSLDQIGPLAKDVTDTAIIMNVICGYDPYDSTSIDKKVPDHTKALTGKLDEIKTVGVVKELLGKGISPEVKKSIEEAIKVYEKLGAKIKMISMPSFEYALSCYYLVATAEASSNLARYDGVKFGLRSADSPDLLSMYYNTRREGFGPEVKRRIMLGTYALSSGYYDAYYLKAQKIRTLIKRDFEAAFKEVDVLISPTTPTVAFNIGEKSDDPLSMYLSDIATIPINLAGIPAISIPCGLAKGLPIGLQIMGNVLEEEKIIKAAYAFEQKTKWHKERPKL
ncbi:MAG: Asp-tRNA(Asn)/Glu-tRNA(Gln) amidotransferase subunit GatA [Candidatus Margulisbacteria bacterium]|nr:Asp-tRNA(Asn)/Glu-tRNA(Gln) amidotransferase subunit GatA [Candidatus Margulisiibacteriota bacterium]MBU1022306.1 Asp-tRNA(Asn)/Glu-tRNA(Gln) amidotransferase subunit GatA [Candidatus Margulisiibacteriota bacterium]MBU1729919.1 Asp-tRNA(Asn)/Glu-tRNA(Gln) amidotransferase subunit GatA [Candidatus Margulisiibacteriota bacterium]MBU1955952.1 Asp-tRNA(Asn)/Glu-tRNA(Gln) amidotransferase subunit GatA [Candidatus Margulisiibacteriota bacterium]